jgi:adenosylcobinamide-phosphate synthase
MSLVAAVIALLLDQVRPIQHARFVEQLALAWVRAVLHWGDTGQVGTARALALLAVAIPAAAAWLIEALLARGNVALGWLWSVAVLYATLGFRQFSHGFTQVRKALDAGDEGAARQALAQWTGRTVQAADADELAQQAAAHGVLQTHRHVLGPLLLFVALPGVGGPVLYRALAFCADHARRPDACSPAFMRAATQMFDAVDAVLVRISAAGFAIAGNFEEAAAAWRQWNLQRVQASSWLQGVAFGALGFPAYVVRAELESSRPGMFANAAAAMEREAVAAPGLRPSHLAHVVGLLWRAVLMWMVLFALLQFTALVT